MALKYKTALKALGIAGLTTVVTTPAYAGPAIPILVGAAVGVATAAAGITILGLGVVATAIVAGVAAAAITAVGISAMTPSFDVPDYSGNTATGATQVNSGILINKVGTNNQIPVVYGERKIGGSRVYVSTDGTNNEYMYIAMVFCEGEINAFKELYFDDKLIAEGTITTQVNNPAYSKDNRLQYELQTGTDGQSPPSFFTSGAPGWTSNHKLSGLAVGYFKCRWVRPDVSASAETQQETADANPYSGIPKIQVVLEGKKVPDATSFNDGESTAYASMTKSYSTNPASQMLDYLLNPRYGRGLDNDRIRFGAFKTAANKFNTTVNYATGGSGKLMENHAVIQTDRTMLENVQTMLQNMRAGMPYVQGKFKLKLLDTGHASDPQNTTPAIAYAVTEREIVGGIVVEGKGHRDQYNQVKAVYPDPLNDWEVSEVVYPEVNSAKDITLLAEDNNKRLTKEISLEQVTNGNIAGDVASIVLNNSRKKKFISFTGTAELHEVEVGDIITITYDGLGFSAAKFRVTSHQITADYTINITAMEHEPTDYEFTNTEVFIQKGVKIASNDPYQSQGGASPSNPQAPYFPGPSHNTNAVVSSATLFSSNTRTLNNLWKTTVTHATDVSQYSQFAIDAIATGSTTPPSEAEFLQKGNRDVRSHNPPYNSVNYLSLGNNEHPSFASAQYLYLRVAYRKTQGNEFILGPWLRVNNNKLTSGSSFP